MKKASRQSHPGKSAAVKQDTSQGDVDGDSNNPQLTGVFCEDFSIICEREGLIKIPLVVHNPKLQCGTSIDDHSSLASRVHVSLEDDEPNSVKHIEFRNMRMISKLASVLAESSKEVSSVQALSLWNTGAPFSDEDTSVILSLWMNTHSIQDLAIGGSVLPFKISDDLIGVNSSLLLQKLSLKCCQLSDSHCERLSSCLEVNKMLLSLHLGCNSITDAGLLKINKALKRNRTLLTLSLMGNKITDEGAKDLAQVLSRFSLTHSEIVDRRKLLLERKAIDEVSLRSSPSNASLSDRSSRQTKGSSSDKGKSTKGKHEVITKKEEKLRKDDKSKKAISSPDPPKKAQKGGRDSKMVTAKKATQLESHPASPKTESTEPVLVTADPLLEEGETVDGTIVLPGNTVLASLSLSNNLITERGLSAFLEAIEIQRQYSHRGQGLLRLEFKNNLFPANSLVARELEELMSIRDPYYEPPPPEQQEDATEITDNSVTLPNT